MFGRCDQCRCSPGLVGQCRRACGGVSDAWRHACRRPPTPEVEANQRSGTPCTAAAGAVVAPAWRAGFREVKVDRRMVVSAPFSCRDGLRPRQRPDVVTHPGRPLRRGRDHRARRFVGSPVFRAGGGCAATEGSGRGSRSLAPHRVHSRQSPRQLRRWRVAGSNSPPDGTGRCKSSTRRGFSPWPHVRAGVRRRSAAPPVRHAASLRTEWRFPASPCRPAPTAPIVVPRATAEC